MNILRSELPATSEPMHTPTSGVATGPAGPASPGPVSPAAPDAQGPSRPGAHAAGDAPGAAAPVRAVIGNWPDPM